MTLAELIKRTRRYVRDTTSKRFRDDEVTDYINEAVDRIRSYPMFRDMPYIDSDDIVYYLPEEFQYMLSVYASSRCFGVDNDFYQEQRKRNEFENLFEDLTSKIEAGHIKILDLTGYEVDYTYPEEYVKDKYFNTIGTSEEGGAI